MKVPFIEIKRENQHSILVKYKAWFLEGRFGTNQEEYDFWIPKVYIDNFNTIRTEKMIDIPDWLYEKKMNKILGDNHGSSF